MDVVCFTSNFPIMGWKWTIQDPTHIHVCHSILCESKYESHFYRIFHGEILPLFQVFFGENAPIPSKEVTDEFIAIGRWFGEELFIYVRVYVSLSKPHFLPLYVPNKLLAREISYETVGNGLINALKETKKTKWPSFPINFGTYAL